MFKKKQFVLLAVAAILVAWFLMLRPASLGGPSSYIMVSGHSMEPTLYTGDLAVVRKQGSYHPGDIVAFRIPTGEPGEGAVVIHRIARLAGGGGFVMQGDNKEHPDPWQPSGDDIVGKMWFSVPGGARFTSVVRAPTVLATLAAAFAIATVLVDARSGNSRPRIELSRGDEAAASPGGSNGNAERA